MNQPDVPHPAVVLAQAVAERTAAGDPAGAREHLVELSALLTGVLIEIGETDVYAQLGQLLPAFDESLGHAHIITLSARHLFAERPQEAFPALNEWLQVFEDEKRVLGADNPTTLISQDRVAQRRKETGDYAGAIAEAEQVLAGRRRVLGDDHVDTLCIRLSLAQWRGEGFDVAAAVAELEGLVDDMREKLGPDHRHTLIARHTLALWGPEPDEIQEAVVTWEELVEAEARVLGEDSPATQSARQELEKSRAKAEEYRYVAEQIYKNQGLFGFDDVAEDEKTEAAAVVVAPDNDAQAWAASQESTFPDWVARFGGGQVWDFSLKSLEAIAYVVFHDVPVVEHLDEPANAAFIDGLTWYLGEILCRLEPGQWSWIYDDKHQQWRADEYRVVSKVVKWDSIPLRCKLNWLIESGDPLDLYRDDHYVIHLHPWPWGYFDTDTGAWTWTGQGRQSQHELWLNAVATRIETLANDYLPDDTALDYSPQSLRRIERFVIDSGIEDPAFLDAVAAYVGESLLRAFGGSWVWDDREHSVTRDYPVVRLFIDGRGGISPTHLVKFAAEWRDSSTFNRVYGAQRRRFFKRKEEDPTWNPMRPDTPGLDAIPERELPYWDSWRAKRQSDFPDFAARYGPDQNWDFSRDSLLKLGEIVTELLDAHDDAAEAAKECAAWYYGETLYRARPSYWGYMTSWKDPQGWIVDEHPADPWGISLTTYSRVGFVGQYPVQDMNIRDYQRDHHRPDWLRNAYDRWVTAEVRERVAEASKRRRLIKRKGSRRISGEKYVQRWLTQRQADFADWVRDYGADGAWDFSPESLDMLEELVIGRGSTPEQLLDSEQNAAFVDGALWYLGETLRKARPLLWEYDRDDDAADPTVGNFDVLEILMGVVTSVDPGSLRQRYDRLTTA